MLFILHRYKWNDDSTTIGEPMSESVTLFFRSLSFYWIFKPQSILDIAVKFAQTLSKALGSAPSIK